MAEVPSSDDEVPVSARRSRRSFLRAGTAGALGLGGGLSLAAHTDAAGATSRRRRLPDFSDLVIPLAEIVISARVIGDGPLIVVCPSLGRSARDLDAMAYELALRGYRVASFDPRGCGQTKAPDRTLAGLTLRDFAADMRSVIEHLGARRAHVLGHAFGNRVARVLATEHPEVVKSVLLCACGSGIPAPGILLPFLTATDSVSPIEEFEKAVRTAFFAAGSDPTPWYVGWFPDGVEAERSASLATPGEQFEGGGSAPMLILQGNQDAIAPPSIGHGLRDKYGDRVTVHDIRGVAHALPVEQPVHVARLIDEYLQLKLWRRERAA